MRGRTKEPDNARLCNSHQAFVCRQSILVPWMSGEAESLNCLNPRQIHTQSLVLTGNCQRLNHSNRTLITSPAVPSRLSSSNLVRDAHFAGNGQSAARKSGVRTFFVNFRSVGHQQRQRLPRVRFQHKAHLLAQAVNLQKVRFHGTFPGLPPRQHFALRFVCSGAIGFVSFFFGLADTRQLIVSQAVLLRLGRRSLLPFRIFLRIQAFVFKRQPLPVNGLSLHRGGGRILGADPAILRQPALALLRLQFRQLLPKVR